jgi:hypothetical protein
MHLPKQVASGCDHPSPGSGVLRCGVWAFVVSATLAAAQNTWGQGIYTCVDAQGRRITSDRPIPECLAREQRELSQAGVTRRVIPASLSAEDKAREETRQQAEAATKARELEERHRDRALLARYPNRTQHDLERQRQLSSVDDVVRIIHIRMEDLVKQRKGFEQEMEFYKADPTKAPTWLKRRFEDNDEQMATQRRALVNQDLEKQRINTHFDEELTRLRQLWSPTPGMR